MTQTLRHLACAGILAALASLPLPGDTVTLQDGSVLNGTIKGIAGGKITLATSFAGDIVIDQSKVASFSTATPVSVRTKDGSVLIGTVAPAPAGLAVATSGGTVTTSVGDVTGSWAAGAEDPAVTALRRKWLYEAAVDVGGKSGNSERFASGLSASATLAGPEDTLKFYGAYNYTKQDGVTSEDSAKAGVDYQAFFQPRLSWYVVGEGGYDKVRDLELRLRAGGGLGFSLIKNARQSLTLRTGVSYRYESYDIDPARLPRLAGESDLAYLARLAQAEEDLDVSSPALDASLIHTYDFGKLGALSQVVSYSPAFDDFGNYLLVHDSHLTLPGGAWWNFRLGMLNEFTSTPAPGRDEWDTTYYARFGVFWR